MLPVASYAYEPNWAIGPMVLYILVSIVIIFYILKFKSARTGVGYTALVAALSGLIYNTLVMVSAHHRPFAIFLTVSPAFFLFYSIYITFAFVPGLVGFWRISRQHNTKKIGKFVVYFGYSWAVVTIVAGFALTIISATKIEQLVEPSYDFLTTDVVVHFFNTVLFLYYSNWALVATSLLLNTIYFKGLKGKARTTMTVYTFLNVIFPLIFVITNFTADTEDVITMFTIIFAVGFALGDIPVAIALIVATHFGHLWSMDSKEKSNNKVEVTSNSSNANLNNAGK